MGINDGLATSFAAKYHYTLWRPITAIQRAFEDGNDATDPDPNWMTLHPNTPPYPSYSSNASTIGAVSATILAGVLGQDVSFDIHWDAYGFPGVTRHYTGLWGAAQEMADSRIYGGIHFRFDCEAGQQIGRDVGHYMMDHFLLPRDDEDDGATGPAALAAVPNAAPNLAFLAGALTASPASSLAAGASSIPAHKEDWPTTLMAAKAQPSLTSQPLDLPTHPVARSAEIDALFADLGGYLLADGL
jgi:hypothetical protein